MAFKDKFANQGLYRLWLICSLVWIVVYFISDGHNLTKTTYITSLEEEWCENVLMQNGEYNASEMLSFKINCDLLLKENYPININPIILLFWISVGLFTPPYSVYLFGRLIGWVKVGFSETNK